MIGRLSYQTTAPAHYSIGETALHGDGRPRFNIAPGQKHSVIRTIDGSPAIGEMTWGRTL
jgi:putative SOS response-associated peptidase YedK